MKFLHLVPALLLAACGSLPKPSPTPSQRASVDQFAWPDGIRAGQSLTVEHCVTLALWNNPEYQAALTDLGISRAEVVKAGQIANPSLALFFPSNAKVLEATAKLPLEALWLRPQRLKIAGIEADATSAKLMQGGADLARDVRVAFAKVTAARAQAAFAEENATRFDKMAQIAAQRQQAGETGGLEAAQARAEAAVARQESSRLAHETQLAMEKLRGFIGLALEPASLQFTESSVIAATSGLSLPASIGAAIASRPDVRAAELAVVSAGHRAGLAKAEIFGLTASAKFTDGAGTQPGFDLPLPIFNQNQAARILANAQLEKAMRQLAAARHKVATEVRVAHAQLAQAKAVVVGWKKVLPELESALEAAQKSVAAGDSNPFVSLDAARRLAEAKSKAADSTARQQEATAELRRAMGQS